MSIKGTASHQQGVAGEAISHRRRPQHVGYTAVRVPRRGADLRYGPGSTSLMGFKARKMGISWSLIGFHGKFYGIEWEFMG